MKPKELTRRSPAHASFSVSKHILPRFLNVWHYHEELELVYIKKSTGTIFVGDSIKTFQPGDLILIGSQLPHLLLNDDKYFKGNTLDAEAWVIHFNLSCLGTQFFHLPEMAKIDRVLEASKVGLKINGQHKSKIVKAVSNMMNEDGFERVLRLLTILGWIADEPKKEKLASLSFIDSYANVPGSKLDTIYEYIFNNFKDNIHLGQVAELANMNPSSFSRYFKQVTNKTFTTFLNEVRIGFACKLILEQRKMNIAEIGFESGYNNLSNFNKQFKNVTGMTPTEYLQVHP
ncbi:MAG: AraC family transcriptional regulator [Cytophagales bacterium]|nr:AraC family transcriptional regulator [Cytophagales bacterium]